MAAVVAAAAMQKKHGCIATTDDSHVVSLADGHSAPVLCAPLTRVSAEDTNRKDSLKSPRFPEYDRVSGQFAADGAHDKDSQNLWRSWGFPSPTQRTSYCNLQRGQVPDSAAHPMRLSSGRRLSGLDGRQDPNFQSTRGSLTSAQWGADGQLSGARATHCAIQRKARCHAACASRTRPRTLWATGSLRFAGSLQSTLRSAFQAVRKLLFDRT